MRPTYHMRCATRDDAPELARLRARSLTELGILSSCQAVAFERSIVSEIADMLAGEMFEARLLITDNQVAGSACIVYWRRLPYPTASLHAELAGVYVAAAYRKRGFASVLCREVVAAAHARGVRSIVVHPSLLGRHLYEMLGFVDDAHMRLASPA